MRSRLKILLASTSIFVANFYASPVHAAPGCGKNKNLFGLFPAWYKYLEFSPDCTIKIESLEDIYKIGGAVIEMVLRIGSVAAVGFIIYGGFMFITSTGDPEGIKNARNTIINAVIGLVITLMAASIVSFVAGKF